MNPVNDDLKYVDSIRDKMNDNRVMLCYRGEMTQDIVIALLNLTENKLSEANSGKALKSRVFSVMIECLQNITRHSEKTDHARSNIFMMGYAEHGFSIYSGNVVRSERVRELQEKIVKINTMSEDELKDFYRVVMKSGSLKENSDSGLGLIQIARKTGNPLEFSFDTIDSNHSFFTLKTLVDH